MKTLARILLPYLGAFTLAALLACPRADAAPPVSRQCQLEAKLMGIIVEARNHGTDVTEVYRAIASLPEISVYDAASWGGLTATVYNDPTVTKDEAMKAVREGCMLRPKHAM